MSHRYYCNHSFALILSFFLKSSDHLILPKHVPSLYPPQAAECILNKQQQKATLTMTKHILHLCPQSSNEHSALPSDSQRYQEKLSRVESIIREMMEETQGLGRHFRV